MKQVVGVVTDSVSGERLPFVNVYSKESKKGTVTDDNGVFWLHVKRGGNVTASSMGYSPVTLSADGGDTLRLMLSPVSKDLDEVFVKPKKEKYSKHNNPAVDLMQLVRKNYDELNPDKEDYYSFDKYEKILVALNDFTTDLTDGNALQKKFAFMQNYIDTAAWTGKPILDISLKEKYSTMLRGAKAEGKKELVAGVKSNGIDESLDQGNVTAVLEDVMREINIYDHDIPLMQNRFVSPLSNIAADYYMFFMTDTVMVAGEDCIELSFAPKTPESFGFNGKLFVPLADSLKYVKRVSMRVPKDINVNYVKNIFVSQNFEKDSIGKIHKTLDDLTLELQVISGTPSLYGSRSIRNRNFSYDRLEKYDEFYDKLGNKFDLEGVNHRDEQFWNANRLISLSFAESNMGELMQLWRQDKLLYWTEKVVRLFVKGYITTGKNSKFDIGPVNTFLSFNTAEGVRLRLGGMTTAHFNDHLFARGYVAYGTKDRKFKYNAELEYSFNAKQYHSREFPMNSIRATYQYDRDQIGQHYLHTSQDNVFLSLKRMSSDLITYRRLAMLEYNLELRNYLSFNVGYRNELQEATRWVNFRDGFGNNHKNFRQGAFFAQIRYAPGEKYVQTMSNRLPVNLDAPVIILSHEYGPRGFMGADFTLNKTELSVQKRFWFSAFGYADVGIKGGKIWSQVQFPALLWQNANISYTIQSESYALLNPMEFAMDQYASWNLEYFINGAIFNRIPLVKKLKLREVFTFKGFVGGLTKKNNPEYNDNLFRFPSDAKTMAMGRTPYMEIAAGIDNIFTILRVDYVWRLTYRDNPGIDRSGLRIALHFSF